MYALRLKTTAWDYTQILVARNRNDSTARLFETFDEAKTFAEQNNILSLVHPITMFSEEDYYSKTVILENVFEKSVELGFSNWR